MGRKDFDAPETYRGGALTVHDKPPAMRYPCFAAGCPMPGTIFTGTTDQAGSCAWHFNVLPTDIPKVTQRLNDWQCVAAEIDEGRRALTSKAAADPKRLDELQAAAWARLKQAMEAGGWGDHLAPNGERYREWTGRLERFLGARVVEVLSTHRRAA